VYSTREGSNNTTRERQTFATCSQQFFEKMFSPLHQLKLDITGALIDIYILGGEKRRNEILYSTKQASMQ
jgi:hypothetical protein